jgi:hypothetical protein
MGKRSDFERKKLDFYATPIEAVRPLIPHLAPKATFCEPCAGAGDLIRHLDLYGHQCRSAFDVAPQAEYISLGDASWMQETDCAHCDLIITNPPWDRPVLHQIIERAASLKPTWLLFDADWMHTAQAARHLEICVKIVSVGRIKWIADSANTGMDNCCWYLFDVNHIGKKTEFVARGRIQITKDRLEADQTKEG